MRCEIVPIKRRRIYFGDLNRKITIHTRSITAPDEPSDYDYSQTYSGAQIVWAAVQTTSGKDIFDGTNMIGTATHIFYVKYISGLTSESMIEWQSEKYRILRIENLDENNEYMAIYSVLRGTISNEVNFQ